MKSILLFKVSICKNVLSNDRANHENLKCPVEPVRNPVFF